MGALSRLHNYTYRKIRKDFPTATIKENAYPDWLISSNLTRLELDIYIEEMAVAIEIQGEQHYSFIPFFHGTYDNFEKRKMYDQEKRDLCYGNKVRLYEVASKGDVDDLLITLTDAKKYAKMPSSEFNKYNERNGKTKYAFCVKRSFQDYVKKPTKKNKELVKKFVAKLILVSIQDGDKIIIDKDARGICYSVMTQEEINYLMDKWEAKGKI